MKFPTVKYLSFIYIIKLKEYPSLLKYAKDLQFILWQSLVIKINIIKKFSTLVKIIISLLMKEIKVTTYAIKNILISKTWLSYKFKFYSF